MRKILLIVVIVLLLALGVTTVVKGISIGNFKVYSIKEIDDKNRELEGKVQELNSLIDTTFPQKKAELTTASKGLQSAKEAYLNEISYTTDEELASVLEIKNFDIERIWAKVGNYALDSGVNINLALAQKSTTGARNMHFTVTGTYVAQTNFLYALEDDPELSYRIYNYKLVPLDGDMLQATFAIKETVITTSLDDDLNGLEFVDPDITDSIFSNPDDAVNGKRPEEMNAQEQAGTEGGEGQEGQPQPQEGQPQEGQQEQPANQ